MFNVMLFDTSMAVRWFTRWWSQTVFFCLPILCLGKWSNWTCEYLFKLGGSTIDGLVNVAWVVIVSPPSRICQSAQCTSKVQPAIIGYMICLNIRYLYCIHVRILYPTLYCVVSCILLQNLPKRNNTLRKAHGLQSYTQISDCVLHIQKTVSIVLMIHVFLLSRSLVFFSSNSRVFVHLQLEDFFS